MCIFTQTAFDETFLHFFCIVIRRLFYIVFLALFAYIVYVFFFFYSSAQRCQKFSKCGTTKEREIESLHEHIASNHMNAFIDITELREL